MATYREMITLLEEAKNTLHYADQLFAQYEKNGDEFYYRMSVKKTERARGILFAYEVVTGHHVICCEPSIMQELEAIQHDMSFAGKVIAIRFSS